MAGAGTGEKTGTGAARVKIGGGAEAGADQQPVLTESTARDTSRDSAMDTDEYLEQAVCKDTSRRITRSELEKLVSSKLSIKQELLDTNMESGRGGENAGNVAGLADYEDGDDDDVLYIGRNDGQQVDEFEQLCGDVVRIAEPNATNINTATSCAGKIELGRNYRTVRAAKEAVSCQRQLNPSATGRGERVGTGSFCTGGDERVLLTNLEHNLQARINKSLSFDARTKQCNTCPAGGHGALESGGGGPVALVASDQCFPACVPAFEQGKECVRVVRVEDGSLQTITHALADAIGSTGLKEGTVILLGSASHLSVVGTGQYISDWVRSRHWLQNRFSGKVTVLPLAPISSMALEGRSLCRALVEVGAWFDALSATEAALMKGINNLILAPLRGGSGTWADVRQCHSAPAGLDTKAYASFVSEGWGGIVDVLPGLSMAAEQVIIEQLVGMLNTTFELNICSTPVTERSKQAHRDRAMDKVNRVVVAVVGGSNAGRLAMALEDTGVSVHDCTVPGWRITKSSVKETVARLEACDPTPDVIVLQGLDNSAFFGLQEDGTVALPQKDTRGRYHVIGELVMANSAQLSNMYRVLEPVFDTVPSASIILATCVPRYCFPGLLCCDDEEHVTNRGEDLPEKIIKSIREANRILLGLVRSRTNLKLLDPLATGAKEATGFTDPVHMTDKVMEALAKLVRGMIAGEAEIVAEGDAPDPKRIRITPQSGGKGQWRGRGGRGGHRGPYRGHFPRGH